MSNGMLLKIPLANRRAPASPNTMAAAAGSSSHHRYTDVLGLARRPGCAKGSLGWQKSRHRGEVAAFVLHWRDPSPM